MAVSHDTYNCTLGSAHLVLSVYPQKKRLKKHSVFKEKQFILHIRKLSQCELPW